MRQLHVADFILRFWPSTFLDSLVRTHSIDDIFVEPIVMRYRGFSETTPLCICPIFRDQLASL